MEPVGHTSQLGACNSSFLGGSTHSHTAVVIKQGHQAVSMPEQTVHVQVQDFKAERQGSDSASSAAARASSWVRSFAHALATEASAHGVLQ